MISIIIPTLNRFKLVNDLLNDLKKQSVDKNLFEILVIDNSDGDFLLQNLINGLKSELNIEYFNEKKRGLHYARHKGLEKSTGEVLTFLDDDVRLSDNWIDNLKNIFEDKNIHLAGGSNHPQFISPVPQWFNNIWNSSRVIGVGKILPAFSISSIIKKKFHINPFYIWGCNFSVRKKILIECRGFNPDGMPLEKVFFRGDGENRVSEYILKNNLKSIFDPKLNIEHVISEKRLNEKYYYKQAYNSGITHSYRFLRSKSKEKFEINKYLNKIVNKFLKLHFFDIETKRVFSTFNKNYAKGFYDHQKEYYKDNNLREWVNRKDYL